MFDLMGFPSSTLAAREEYILSEIKEGRYEATLTPLDIPSNDHTLRVWVYADALKVNGIRVNATPELEQRIADHLGCCLLTAKLADLIWLGRGFTLAPMPRPITSTTQAMIEQSRKIDAALPPDSLALGTLISTLGKHWLLDNDALVVNYGWHFLVALSGIKGEPVASLAKNPKTGQYYRLIQGRGFKHGFGHTDYSQNVILVSWECELDGQPADLRDILVDPVLSKLVSHQGPLKRLRILK